MSPSKLSREPSEDQIPLIELSELAKVTTIDGKQEGISGLGPSVSIEDRTVHLINALNSLSQASQRAGFQIAASSRRHHSEIAGQYGSNTTQVVRGAANNEKQLNKEARWSFAYASGHFALINSGLSENVVKADSRADFRHFMNMYAGSGNRDRRDAYRQQLTQNLALMQKKDHHETV